MTTRADGSLLVAGWMQADELADQLRITLESPRDYETVAGLVLDRMGRLPEVGDSAEIGHWRIERIDIGKRFVGEKNGLSDGWTDKVDVWPIASERESIVHGFRSIVEEQ